MARTSSILLPSTTDQMNVVGEAARTNGFYGQSDYLHTVSVHMTNFTGTIHIEASIATTPGAEDWFDVVPAIVESAKTGSSGFSFRGNYLWLRARVDRSDLPLPVSPATIDGAYGTVNRIFLNM